MRLSLIFLFLMFGCRTKTAQMESDPDLIWGVNITQCPDCNAGYWIVECRDQSGWTKNYCSTGPSRAERKERQKNPNSTFKCAKVCVSIHEKYDDDYHYNSVRAYLDRSCEDTSMYNMSPKTEPGIMNGLRFIRDEALGRGACR